MSFAELFLLFFCTKISGLQRRRVHHGLLLWLVLKSSYMRNPGSIQHFFLLSVARFSALWSSESCKIQETRTWLLHFAAETVWPLLPTMSSKLIESWVDLHQCSSMFSCFEGCVAHVGLVLGDHMFSTATSSRKSMQRLERSFTKLRRGCIRVRQRRRLWKRRKRWKRWSEHWSVADDTSSF